MTPALQKRNIKHSPIEQHGSRPGSSRWWACDSQWWLWRRPYSRQQSPQSLFRLEGDRETLCRYSGISQSSQSPQGTLERSTCLQDWRSAENDNFDGGYARFKYPKFTLCVLEISLWPLVFDLRRGWLKESASSQLSYVEHSNNVGRLTALKSGLEMWNVKLGSKFHQMSGREKI